MYTDEYLEVYDVVEVSDCGLGHYLHHFDEFSEGLLFEIPCDNEQLYLQEDTFI